MWSKKEYKEQDLSKVIERVKRNTLIKDYSEGGLNMIDMFHMQSSISIKWITKLLQPGNGIWRAIPLFYLNKFGPNMLIFKMNTTYREIRGWEKYYPQYYKSLIEMWCKIPSKNKNKKFRK